MKRVWGMLQQPEDDGGVVLHRNKDDDGEIIVTVPPASPKTSLPRSRSGSIGSSISSSSWKALLSPSSSGEGRHSSRRRYYWWSYNDDQSNSSRGGISRMNMGRIVISSKKVFLILLLGLTLFFGAIACVWKHVSPPPLNGTWMYGRYHNHVKDMQVSDAAYHKMVIPRPPPPPSDPDLIETTSPQEEMDWTSPFIMEMHCPSYNISMLPEDLLQRKIFIAANLMDNEGVMANLIRQLRVLASLFPSYGQLYVSIYESNSRDSTKRWLKELKDELEILGIEHHIVGNGKGRRKHGIEDRIEFLARMRNRAMAPFYQGLTSTKKFDHVVFINDVFFCSYEILRLMMYDADLSCGMDLYLEPQPYKDPATAHIRKDLTFYDAWVARDETGKSFDWGPPFVRTVRGVQYPRSTFPSSDDLRRGSEGTSSSSIKRKQQEEEEEKDETMMMTAGPFEHTEAFPVFCCWNGMAVLKAEPFHRGLRFRSTRPGQGVVSECSNLCIDLWANGYSKIIVDPQVKLAYDEPTYEKMYQTLPSRYSDLYHVDRLITPSDPYKAPASVTTCFLETGPRKEGGSIHFDQCRDDLPDPLAGAITLSRLCQEASSDTSSSSFPPKKRQIPRRLIQLEPFPLDDPQAKPSSSTTTNKNKKNNKRSSWFNSKKKNNDILNQQSLEDEKGPGHWKALWYDWKRVHMATEDYDPDDDELLLMDGSGTGGYKAILYNQAEALAVVNTHFPLAGPILRRLSVWKEWGLYRSLLSLILLYHHGGILISPLGQYHPIASSDCLLNPEDTLVLDLHLRRDFVSSITAFHNDEPVPDFLLPPPIDAWTPDLGIIAAQRHDPLLRFVIENVFFDQGPLDALSSSSPAALKYGEGPGQRLRNARKDRGEGLIQILRAELMKSRKEEKKKVTAAAKAAAITAQEREMKEQQQQQQAAVAAAGAGERPWLDLSSVFGGGGGKDR